MMSRHCSFERESFISVVFFIVYTLLGWLRSDTGMDKHFVLLWCFTFRVSEV